MKIFMSYLVIVLSTISSCNGIKCNFTFQEDVNNYPERIIDQILSRKKASFFNRTNGRNSQEFNCEDDIDEDLEVVPVTKKLFVHKNAGPTFRKPIDVETRFDNTNSTAVSKEAFPMEDDEDRFSEPACAVTKSTIFPKTLPNLLNKLVVVVNHAKFRQEVKIERCSNESQPCNFSENFPFGVITKCKQKYLTQTIKVLNEDDQKIMDESVYYPSGCECRIYSTKKKTSTSIV